MTLVCGAYSSLQLRSHRNSGAMIALITSRAKSERVISFVRLRYCTWSCDARNSMTRTDSGLFFYFKDFVDPFGPLLMVMACGVWTLDDDVRKKSNSIVYTRRPHRTSHCYFFWFVLLFSSIGGNTPSTPRAPRTASRTSSNVSSPICSYSNNTRRNNTPYCLCTAHSSSLSSCSCKN
jgi:hypothetical protein